MTMVSSCIAGLLLLLAARSAAAAVGLATPVEYQYHSYAVTPLSPHAHSSPEAAEDGAHAHQEDMAASSSSAMHVRLLHRDSFAVNATGAELLARRLQRDELRAAWIISTAAANGTPPPDVVGLSTGRGLVAPVVSRAPTSGDYIAKIAVGTPAVEALLALDTASDLTWLQCQPCRRCYPQSGPVFDPRHSTSYGEMNYDAPDCQALGRSGGGDAKRGTCIYTVLYGDGDGHGSTSTSVGDLVEETLTFAGGVRQAYLSIGCGHDNKGLFGAPAAGILGLSRGQISIPHQIAFLGYNASFSYCLVDFISGPGSPSSTLTFGAGAVDTSPPASFTPTVLNQNMPTFYYVRLIGVSVGGVRVPGVTERDLQLDPYTGHGGVILDSGTTVTRLARPAYTAFRDAFRAAATGLGQVSTGGPSGLFDTCYTVGGRAGVKVPAVSMHFAGGVELSLQPKNYLITVDSRGTVCFAFAGTGDRSVSVIGNILQQGFRVVYDIGGQRVGFAPNSC
ncbi:aspartyl protease family protein 2 [Sorghum bicolor]|nr:aspartyl protease family protein 2 [Sorghum bicolor]|eukprot:XP_021321604.1 aspartyl protease family protein 2 [Sorghum bicolor]